MFKDPITWCKDNLHSSYFFNKSISMFCIYLEIIKVYLTIFIYNNTNIIKDFMDTSTIKDFDETCRGKIMAYSHMFGNPVTIFIIFLHFYKIYL